MEDLSLVGEVLDPLGLGKRLILDRSQILGKDLDLGKGHGLDRSQILGKDHGLGRSLDKDLGRILGEDLWQDNGSGLGAFGTCHGVSEVGKVQTLLWGRFFLPHQYNKDFGVLILNHLKTVQERFLVYTRYFPGPIWTPAMNHPRLGKVGNTVQVHSRSFLAPILTPSMNRPGLGRLWRRNH